MNRRDQGKVSLVEFLRSIKFTQHSTHQASYSESQRQFAHFKPSARANEANAEESQLIRSAN